MKSKVIRAFTCVNTRVRYNIGDTYEADTNRINQLVSKGYVKAEVAHIPKAEVAAPSKAEVPHYPAAYINPNVPDIAAPIIKPKRKRNESK